MKSCRVRPDTMLAAPSTNTPRRLVIPCPVLYRFQPPSCSITPRRISHFPSVRFPVAQAAHAWTRLSPDSKGPVSYFARARHTHIMQGVYLAQGGVNVSVGSRMGLFHLERRLSSSLGNLICYN